MTRLTTVRALHTCQACGAPLMTQVQTQGGQRSPLVVTQTACPSCWAQTRVRLPSNLVLGTATTSRLRA